MPQLVLILFLTIAALVGCSDAAPEVGSRDAGAPETSAVATATPAPSLAPLPSPSFSPSASTGPALVPEPRKSFRLGGLWSMPAQRRAPRFYASAATDPRIARCMTEPTWSDFETCVKMPPSLPSGDAGAHRLGAVQPPIVCPAAAVTNWYVNPSTGNDNNTCLDNAHACATKAQIDARNGCGGSATVEPLTSVPVTINLTGDTTECWSVRPRLRQGSLSAGYWSYQLLGSMIQVATGSIVSVAQAKNRALGRIYQTDIGAAAASSVGNFLRDATRGSSMVVDRIISGNVVQVSQPVDLADDFSEKDTLTAGDAIVIERPPNVCLAEVRPELQGGDTVLAPGGLSAVGLQNLHLLNTGLNASIATIGAGSYIARSIVDCNLILDDSSISNSKAAVLVGHDSTVNAGIVANLDPWINGGIGDDVILRGAPSFEGLLTTYDYVYMDGAFNIKNGTVESNGAGMIYGTSWTLGGGAFSRVGGLIYSSPTYPTGPDSAALSFPGLTGLSATGPTNTIYAVDRSCNPVIIYPGRALTLAAINAPIGGPSGTGFGGIVYLPGMNPLMASIKALSTPVTPVACPVPLNGIAACANGQILQTVGGVQTCVTVSGDATLAVGGAATLASVGTPGACGDATHVCATTFDAKGRETAAVATSIAGLPLTAIASCGTNGQIVQTVTGVQTCVTVSGDMTLAAGGAATLASVGTAGLCGDATHVCAPTFDAKGRETAVSSVAITGLPIASLAGCGVNNQIIQTVSGAQTCETVSGDMTLVAGVATLATSGVTAGTYGDATHVAQVTLDAKGRATSAANVVITAGSGTVTLAGDTTGPSGSNTTSGLQAKALPALPISGPAQYLGYTGAAWSFFSPLDIAAGTGVTITGSPTKTIALTGGPVGSLMTTANTGTAQWGLNPTATTQMLVPAGPGGGPYFWTTGTPALPNQVIVGGSSTPFVGVGPGGTLQVLLGNTGGPPAFGSVPPPRNTYGDTGSAFLPAGATIVETLTMPSPNVAANVRADVSCTASNGTGVSDTMFACVGVNVALCSSMNSAQTVPNGSQGSYSVTFLFFEASNLPINLIASSGTGGEIVRCAMTLQDVR